MSKNDMSLLARLTYDIHKNLYFDIDVLMYLLNDLRKRGKLRTYGAVIPSFAGVDYLSVARQYSYNAL